MSDAQIVVRDLRKEFRVHQRAAGLLAATRSLFRRPTTIVKAVDGISFSLARGERVGFLGPNGAGKTTTLKTLAGLLHPTSGEVRVDGHVPQKREVRFLEKVTLVMGQKQQLLWDLPPVETFELNRAVYEVPRTRFEKTVRELSELLELGDLVKKPTRELSLGERMKCELIAALIHEPKVLFLDEPTIGLDVAMQVAVREFVRRYNQEHEATLILTSHYMDDVAALCPRVLVIDKGVLSYDGALDELVRRVRPEKRVVLRFSRAVERGDLDALGKIVEHAGERAVIDVPQQDLGARVSRALETLPVIDLEVTSAPLEEVMSELFARTRKERAEHAR
ncbi:ABC transporter ATP-binding protein [Sandaracinus amylolyticus]|nr:ATP-binding cassette domain-containing protein [Sandaracinus amylolyticus]